MRLHVAVAILVMMPGCFLEGAPTFQLQASNSASVAVDVTVEVERSGELLTNRTLHLDGVSPTLQPVVSLGKFSKPGDYSFRARTNSSMLAENISFARHDSNLAIMIWVDKDLTLHLSRAVV